MWDRKKIKKKKEQKNNLQFTTQSITPNMKTM